MSGPAQQPALASGRHAGQQAAERALLDAQAERPQERRAGALESPVRVDQPRPRQAGPGMGVEISGQRGERARPQQDVAVEQQDEGARQEAMPWFAAAP